MGEAPALGGEHAEAAHAEMLPPGAFLASCLFLQVPQRGRRNRGMKGQGQGELHWGWALGRATKRGRWRRIVPGREWSLPYLGLGPEPGLGGGAPLRGSLGWSFPLNMKHGTSPDPRLTSDPRMGTMTAGAELLPEVSSLAQRPSEIPQAGRMGKSTAPMTSTVITLPPKGFSET